MDFRDFEAQAGPLVLLRVSHGSGLSCSEPGLVCGAHPWADLGVGSRASRRGKSGTMTQIGPGLGLQPQSLLSHPAARLSGQLGLLPPA